MFMVRVRALNRHVESSLRNNSTGSDITWLSKLMEVSSLSNQAEELKQTDLRRLQELIEQDEQRKLKEAQK
ncbi:hypothetical protein NPIL_406631 [Nephila pilipes]|uniref:Uncharacterized protein n=1 Tax=Nephila pilipes TaxID=299642 RepID=A0A8X6MV40_NEPPI|nr:hypothetical protein NPIL_406631 [Nephila pilipes]